MKPKFILSKKIVLEKYAKARELADIVSYSSKTNPIVTEILEDETYSMFGVHSISELKNIKDKSRIIFLAQGWNGGEINFLIEKGIIFFVVDNIQDLETLKSFMINLKEHSLVHPELRKEGAKINLFLRLKLKENTLKTEKHFVFGFGSEYINKEILELKKLNFVEGIGIHFHRKTQNMAEWNLKKEIENVLDLGVLKKIDYLIMGGGLPSIYANTNVKVFEGIYSKIEEFREWLNSFGIRVINEPGRFISAPAVKLETNIRAIYENNIVVDASVYNSDLDALVVPVKLLVEGELLAPKGVLPKGNEGEAYVIKGITPCSMDLFRYRVYLKNPVVGDKLIFLNAGAYNFSSEFCDLEKIETLVVD